MVEGSRRRTSWCPGRRGAAGAATFAPGSRPSARSHSAAGGGDDDRALTLLAVGALQGGGRGGRGARTRSSSERRRNRRRPRRAATRAAPAAAGGGARVATQALDVVRRCCTQAARRPSASRSERQLLACRRTAGSSRSVAGPGPRRRNPSSGLRVWTNARPGSPPGRWASVCTRTVTSSRLQLRSPRSVAAVRPATTPVREGWSTPIHRCCRGVGGPLCRSTTVLPTARHRPAATWLRTRSDPTPILRSCRRATTPACCAPSSVTSTGARSPTAGSGATAHPQGASFGRGSEDAPMRVLAPTTPWPGPRGPPSSCAAPRARRGG